MIGASISETTMRPNLKDAAVGPLVHDLAIAAIGTRWAGAAPPLG
jgi:hypothetical protein